MALPRHHAGSAAHGPGVNVVLCSGFSVEGKGSDLLTRGAARFVQKPVQFDDLTRLRDETLR